MFDRASKDDSILAVLDALESRLAPGTILIRDYWDADLCAIGISSEAHPERVVYISTWRMPSGRYYVDCEPTPGEAPRAAEEVDLETLLEIVRKRLA